MNRLDIIQTVINKTGAKNYIEIGIRSGTVLLPLKVSNKIGVDPNIRISWKTKIFYFFTLLKSKLFGITSDEFFEKHAGKHLKNGIDVAFVDGMHTYEQSSKDINNCLKYLNKNGVIIVHDCNPTNEAGTIVPRELAQKTKGYSSAWWGDVWKVVADLRSSRNDLEIFVVDEDHGLGIIRKGTPNKMLEYTKQDINNLKYKDLEENREKILNLKKYDYLNNCFDK